jgi:hypothetical protein
MPRKTRLKAKGQRTRGRHKHRYSPETKVWNRLMKKGKAVTKL